MAPAVYLPGYGKKKIFQVTEQSQENTRNSGHVQFTKEDFTEKNRATGYSTCQSGNFKEVVSEFEFVDICFSWRSDQ